MKFLIKLLFCILAILIFLSFRTDAAAMDAPEETEAVMETEEEVSEQEETRSETETNGENAFSESEASASAEEWMSYIKNEVLPLVAMALSVVASVYVAISPAIYKIKRRSEDFRRATEGVTAATGAVEENRRQISRVEENLGEETKRMREELSECRGELERMNRILRIAFSNQEELVKKGVAMKIADIVHEKEREERKNERTES